MFGKYKDDKTREWDQTIQRYISLHKYIKEVGKIGISQARAGPIDQEVQVKLADALKQTETALHKLKEFFRPCLTTVDVTDIFPKENLKTGDTTLIQQVDKLEAENQFLKRELSEYKVHKEVQIRKLQSELVSNEQQFEQKYEALQREKRLLEQQILQLAAEMERLRHEYQQMLFSYEADMREGNKNGNTHMPFIKRQQELEETLKTQNDLIYNLKQQLAESERDREIFKSLNRTLGSVLQKREPRSRSSTILDDQDEYFNRQTLRIGEYDAQTESWKNHGNIGPMENFIGSHEPLYKSLQELSIHRGPEHTFLKSKSYDFDKQFHPIDDSISLPDSKSLKNLQALPEV